MFKRHQEKLANSKYPYEKNIAMNITKNMDDVENNEKV